MVSVINFLAEHPRQAFSLTEIVRSLKLNRTTCHSLVNALVDVDYIYRAIDRAYLLGPILATVGKVAYENLSPLQVPRPERRILASLIDAPLNSISIDTPVTLDWLQAANAKIPVLRLAHG